MMSLVKATLAWVTILLLVNSCVTVLEPEYDFVDDLVFIDAYLTDKADLSFVIVKETSDISDATVFRSVPDAQVRFENSQDNRLVWLEYDTLGVFLPPEGFAGSEGDRWKLVVEFSDGRAFESNTETLLAGVPIQGIKAEFKNELVFSQSYNDFVPGHRVSIDFTDPSEPSTYYLWRSRSFEREIICRTCNNGTLREGVCIPNSGTPRPERYFDYLCEGDCWEIRYGNKVSAFSDEFSNGESVLGQAVADIIFYKKQNIVVEVQQLVVNKATYKYYKSINDLIAEGGGLNAPTPAALFGNLRNLRDGDQVVLGHFTVASVSTSSIYINRQFLPVLPIDPDHRIRVENCFMCPQTTSCDESRTRTSIEPDGWEG